MADLLPGAEPFSAAGGPHGVLVLHGFTGSPNSIRPLADALADAGYAVELPLLPGHGTTEEDLAEVGWDEWLDTAETALDDLSARGPHGDGGPLDGRGARQCPGRRRRPGRAGGDQPDGAAQR